MLRVRRWIIFGDMAARGSRLHKLLSKHGVDRIHRAAEKQRTVVLISGKEQQALTVSMLDLRLVRTCSGRIRVPSVLDRSALSGRGKSLPKHEGRTCSTELRSRYQATRT
jgi:hypothetical protein